MPQCLSHNRSSINITFHHIFNFLIPNQYSECSISSVKHFKCNFEISNHFMLFSQPHMMNVIYLIPIQIKH